jgi:hypothetical protein
MYTCFFINVFCVYLIYFPLTRIVFYGMINRINYLTQIQNENSNANGSTRNLYISWDISRRDYRYANIY